MNKEMVMQVISSFENEIRIIIIVLWGSSRGENNTIVMKVERATEVTNTVERNSSKYETLVFVELQFDFRSPKKNATRHEMSKCPRGTL